MKENLANGAYDYFIEDLTNPRTEIAFIFGAGISIALTGTALNWQQWLSDGCKMLSDTELLNNLNSINSNTGIDKLKRIEEQIRIAQKIVDKLNQNGKYEQWMSGIEDHEITDNDLALTLKGLSESGILFTTTNYDRFLEKATGLESVTTISSRDLAFSAIQKKNKIIHLHGYYSTSPYNDDSQIGNLDYNEILSSPGIQFINATISTKTCVFIGCGETIYDPNISKLIAFAADELHLAHRNYYLCRPADLQNLELPNSLRPICYGNDYNNLPVFLKTILNKRSATLNPIVDIRSKTLSDLKPNFDKLKYKDEIPEFIPRSVITDNPENEKKPFFTWATDFSKSKIKILEAPAGYGKTGLLEMLYIELHKTNVVKIPPLFIPIENIDTKEDIFSFYTDRAESLCGFEKNERYFIIDNFDELDNKNKETLMQELSLITSSAMNHYRACALIAVRSGEYDKEEYEKKYNIDCAHISPLNTNDINEIVTKSYISKEYKKDFFQYLTGNDQIESIFYLKSYIKYYKKYKRIDDVISLYEFLLQEDLAMLGRNHQSDIVNIYTAVLDSIVANRNTGKVHENFFKAPFTITHFSHRSIEEYLAAKLISSLNISKMKELLFSRGIIVPHLRNTTGLLLSILAREQTGKFKKLYKLIMNSDYNIYVLSSIEPGLLSSEMIKDILKRHITTHIKNHDFNIPDDFISFASANYALFIDECFNEYHSLTKNRDILLYIIYIVILRSGKELYMEDTSKFLSFLLQLIDYADEDRLRQIKYITSILRHNKDTVVSLSSDGIQKIIKFIEKHRNTDDKEMIMSFFSILEQTAQKLSAYDFEKITDIFLSLHKANSMSLTTVPSEYIDGYKEKPYVVFTQFPFFDLADAFCRLYPEQYIFVINKHLEFFSDEKEIDALHAKSLNEFCLKYALKSDVTYPKIEQLLQLCKIEEESDTETFLTELKKESSDEARIVKATFLTVFFLNKDKYGNEYFLSTFWDLIEALFTDLDLYLLFKSELNDKTDEALCYYFKFAPANLNIAIPLPQPCLDIVQERKNRKAADDKNNEEYEKMIATSFHIAFCDVEFKKEVHDIFELSKTRKEKQIRNLSRNTDHRFSLVNQFLLDVIAKSRKTTEEDFLSYWFNTEQYQFTVIKHIVYYFEKRKLPYTLLMDSEIQYICNYVDDFLIKYPFNKLVNGHMLVAILMRKKELIHVLKPIIQKHKKIENLIAFSGLEYSYLFGIDSGMITYEKLAPDYLRNYIDEEIIFQYIKSNFHSSLNNTKSVEIIRCTGYIAEKAANKKLNSISASELKHTLLDYLNQNLKKEPSLIDFSILDVLGISSIDININKIASAIISDPENTNTIAYRLLSLYEHKDNDDNARNAASYILKKIINSPNPAKRKDLTERYVSLNGRNHWMNRKLIKAYRNKDIGVSSYLRTFTFDSFLSIWDIKKLYLYSISQDDEKHKKLRRIAVSSYSSIFNRLVEEKSYTKALYLLQMIKNLKKYSMNDNAISSLIESFTIKLADNRYSAPKSHTLRNIAINTYKKLNEGS